MLQTYQDKQKARYFECLATGREPAALDALWRAASNADLLDEGREGRSHHELTPARISELLKQLDWND